MNNLFSPIKIRNTIIKNRVVMPPMVCFGFGGDDGLVTEKHIAIMKPGLRVAWD